MTSESTVERALKLVLALFPPGPAHYDQVVANCTDIITLLELRGDPVPDTNELIKEVESRLVIWQDESTSLHDSTGHVDWLVKRRTDVDWSFWDRYRRYLEQVELLPPSVIARTDESTDRVLSKLEDPLREGSWDRRGLVVGNVQSGKTGHYTALAAKAADAGYKLIVVLAGMHNSLRSQTQLRLDEGLLGFDSQFQYRYDEHTQSRIGVGALAGAKKLKIASLTSSHSGGDFKKVRAQHLALPIGDMPVLLVVKKHGGILDNLRSWVTQMHGSLVSPGSNQLIVNDIPLLVIDDEADTASINTKDPDQVPAVINQRIRTLLNSFAKSGYVGYTATPYANIYSSSSSDEVFGYDLFPRHFIESLKAPSNYFGPVRVFGLDGGENSPEKEPLPIYRPVVDYTKWIPDKHDRHWQPPQQSFPDSLREAVLAFFIVCAARYARGQMAKHNSMLIHVTRLQDVQGRVAEQVEDLVASLRYRLRYGDGDGPSLRSELEALWNRDFVPTTQLGWGEDASSAWNDVAAELENAVAKIVVRTINGSSRDALEYYDNRSTGISVIAIGGDKLSRGLTLEGLSVSYFLRTARMYDTLLQMGRWFGYRPGYEDLCRLYTTTLLYAWYREITVASEELRTDFDEMALNQSTPENFGLRVRQSAAGLSVTSPTKMRSASTVTLSFSGDISETVTFDCRDEALECNRITLNNLVSDLSNRNLEVSAKSGNYMWTNVPGSVVADDFFGKYRAEKMAHRARPELVRQYIRSANQQNELTSWTVVLVSNSQTNREADVGPKTIGLTVRSALNGAELSQDNRYTIRRILSPTDESLDLSESERQAAMQSLREILRAKATTEKPYVEPTYPRGPTLRKQRSPSRGLLLLYLFDDGQVVDSKVTQPMVGWAASFPYSDNGVVSTYQVNEIWRALAFSELVDDDEDK